MKPMSRQHKALLAAFLAMSFIQMPIMALTPAIEYIRSNVFTDRSLADIQTAVTALNLFVMLFALLAALLIGSKILSKKTVVVIGLILYGVTGLAAVLLHTQFWNLWLYSVLIGAGCGFFVSTLTSVLFDVFNERELQQATGLQASAVNIGGIVFGALGGALTTVLWYGGYVLEIIGLPLVLLALIAIPGKRTRIQPDTAAGTGKKTKMPRIVLYYTFVTFIFFMLYIACGTNISTHLTAAGFGNPAVAGLASALQMAGGVAAGLLFGRLSNKLHDRMIPLAFAVMFLGLTVLNIGHALLGLNLLGVFLVGMSLSLVFPQCLYATSQHVDAANSATAASLVQAIAPGLGGFISPMILTRLTLALGGESTQFRYQFIGFVALALAVILFIVNPSRSKAHNISPAVSSGVN